MSSKAARAVRIAALEVHTQAAPARMLLEWWRLELEHQATELWLREELAVAEDHAISAVEVCCQP